MSIYAGPSIQSRGLILSLDASNPRSYPGSGTTWYDLSGRGNHGTLINGPVFSSANGGSIIFDALNDYVDLPYVLLSGTMDFTINLWIKSNIQSGYGSIFANYPAGTLELIYGTNYLGLWLNNNSTYLSSPGTEFTNNPVFFTAMRIGGSETRCYLNTILKKTGSSTSSIGTTNNFRMGTNTTGGERYSGAISSIQIYDRALSLSEIQQSFNSSRNRFGM